MARHGGRAREAGRRFGEEVVEAMVWSAIEDALLERGADEAVEFLAGIEAWGAELLGRWGTEVAGFGEAFEEDQAAGRLDRLRELARRSVPPPTTGRVRSRGPFRSLVAMASS